MDRIQKVSTYLIWVCNLWLMILSLPTILLWGMKDFKFVQQLITNGFLETSIKTPEGFVHIQNLTLTPLSQGIGLLSSIIGILPLLLGIMVLKDLFVNYRNGNIFSLENALKYKRLAWLFFLNAILAMPLCEAMSVVAATLSNAPGHRYIVLSFGTPHLGSVLGGIILVIMSWIMTEAYKLQEDKNLTI